MESFEQDVFGWFKIAYDKKLKIKNLDMDGWDMGPQKMSHKQCNYLNMKWNCLLTKIVPFAVKSMKLKT